MSEKIEPQFDPNGVGLKNGQFMGLPYALQEASVVILPAPWDVTVSYGEGTRKGPEQVIEASSQLDLMSPLRERAHELKAHNLETSHKWWSEGEKLRAKASEVINFLESGGMIEESPSIRAKLEEVNRGCTRFHQELEDESRKLIEAGKKVLVLGGDHSTPLGSLRAHAQKHADGFDILQIDAHADLRVAYEGFEHSHASIMHNVLALEEVQNLVQVGVRDFCLQEKLRIESDDRIHCFTDWGLKAEMLRGSSWHDEVQRILACLGPKVYISVDIDGLDPSLCPNTGTSVPGGLSFDQWTYLLEQLILSEREIIGADLVEVSNGDSGEDWDSNVGARVLFQLALALSPELG